MADPMEAEEERKERAVIWQSRGRSLVACGKKGKEVRLGIEGATESEQGRTIMTEVGNMGPSVEATRW